MARYPIGIIYILRDKFQIFVPCLPSVQEFRFVPEIVRDLDVVNKELLFNLLKLFITSNKITPTSLIIVIANSASIMKDFIAPALTPEQCAQPENQTQPPKPNLEQAQKQADEFLEHIPFEEVASKSIPIENGIRAYAANKDLYESIKECFVHSGSEVISILPATVIGPELTNALDAAAINAILKKYTTLKQFNLNTQSPVLQLKYEAKEEEKKEIETTDEIKQEKKPGNRRIILLVGVFIFLIIVLVVVFMTQK